MALGDPEAVAFNFGLTLTSHNAKILHADRQPKGDSSSNRQAQRMERILKCLVQDHQARGLENFC